MRLELILHLDSFNVINRNLQFMHLQNIRLASCVLTVHQKHWIVGIFT